MLEIIVLAAIVIEIYSLTRHAKLEHKIEERMELLDVHMKRLDDHIAALNKQGSNQS